MKRAGGRSIVTAGSKEKIDLCLQLGAERGVNYRQEEFQVARDTGRGGGNYIGATHTSQSMEALTCISLKLQGAVLDWSAGKGVDIILDCVGGSYSQANLACLTTDAR